MTEDEHRPAGEPQSVQVDAAWQRAYWARRLRVPVERVQAAVSAVGHDPAAVAAHLGCEWPGDETIA